ncbi:MAG: DUF3391 domain-containing protein [Tolumonas sp.]|nr:DUF3391 domain-containing protein [Tolumonas sp.]
MNEIKVSVKNLQIGNYIRLPLTWHKHPFLLSNFMIKNEEQIKIIQQLELEYVFLVVEKSETSPKKNESEEIIQLSEECNNEDITDLQIKMHSEKLSRIEQLQKYKRSQKRAEETFKHSFSQVRGLINKLQTRPLNAIHEARELIDYISKQLINADQITLHLMDDSTREEGLYYHSLNVATLSMLIAKQCNKSEFEMKLIGMAAIFHDIGKIKLPTQILRKAEPLTKPEENLYQMHPVYGLRLLDLMPNFPDQAKEIILQHHERLDGSGYPKGIDGTQINNLTQLLSVVDEYDYICNPLLKAKQPVPPYTALSFLFKHRSQKLNKNYIQLLIKQLGIYPPGCVVELSNGHIGLIMSVNSNRLLYPKLMIYDPHVPRDKAAIIDLEHVSLSIKRALQPSRLPKEIFNYLSPRTCTSYFFDAVGE